MSIVIPTSTDDDAIATAFDLMVQPAPSFDQETATALARNLFGIEGSLSPLTSERDQNFLLRGADGDWVLKISNAHEDPAVTDFQTRAVNHALSRNPSLPLPPFLESRSGRPVEVVAAADGEHAVRMLAFVPGAALKTVSSNGQLPTDDFAYRLGELLAQLAEALADFEHPAADHAILWDLTHFPALEPLLETVRDAEEKSALHLCFKDYTDALGVLRELPRQVIYNDLNDSNVLLDAPTRQTISGLIDFGDVVRAPRVFDLAVATSYRLTDPDGPTGFLRGYTDQTPLTALELDLLPLLVRCRLATTLLITQWRAARFPDNSDYILRNHPAARQALLGFNETTLRP